MANDDDKDARKARAERLQKQIDAQIEGAGSDPSNPRSFTDAAAAEAGSETDEHDYAKPLLMLKKRSSFVRETLLTLPKWVTPNGVTIFRTALIVPIVLFLRGGSYWPAFATLLAAMLLDFVDGALAEIRNEKSFLGAFLDPLADKVLICGTLLAILNRVPAEFLYVTVGVCAIAALQTGNRVLKMARQRRGEPEPAIAASSAGKLKLIAEAVGLHVTILGLGVGSGKVVWIGFVLLCIALYYALTSFRDQLFSRIKVG